MDIWNTIRPFEICERNLFIGIDAGTSVIKSVLFDKNGNELAIAHVDVPTYFPKKGYEEKDMNEVWEAIKSTIKTIVHNPAYNSSLVRAIGVTANGCGCWLIDKNGNPVRNAILWSDRRSDKIVKKMYESGIDKKIYKLCGSNISSGNQASIIKWLSINEPDTLKKAHYALYCRDWIKYKLTGVISTDSSEAILSYGNIHTNEYSPEVLHILGIQEFSYLFPEIRECYKVTGNLLPRIAKDIGLTTDVQVVQAAMDISACAIGVGAIKDGDACTMIGTALVSEVVTDTPDIDNFRDGFNISLGIPSRWVHLLNTNFGTPNLDWFIKNFCYEDITKASQKGINIFNYLEEKISKITVGSEGILYNPFICSSGTRLSFLNVNAKAHFIGLGLQHTRHHMLRALFEGVTMAIKHTYENIPRKFDKISLSGGGTKSALWCQMIADSLNTIVRIPSGSEFGAKGAANWN